MIPVAGSQIPHLPPTPPPGYGIPWHGTHVVSPHHMLDCVGYLHRMWYPRYFTGWEDGLWPWAGRAGLGGPWTLNLEPLNTYIQTYIPTYLHTYKHTYLPTYIHTNIHTYLQTYIQTYIPTYIHTNIPTYLPTYIHTYIHTYVQTYIPTYLHK